jgi:DNA polymerase-3 subunit gamma/tau
VTTALYRRYRPDTFEAVIGQEHVTEPLKAALAKNRVNHAYLFSGPRGCGKTTSARILARCLNCAKGPTPTPCGECDSCRDLAQGGPGSIDVIEIDAASHGGVDDARDLRERATFAPARDRFKIFIIDEAHMVTSAGFNALLKIVEEPPEHIKFIFATTEPDKVIGTIRSRTHHYPFRLVPPETLQNYLTHLCQAEGVEVAPGVLPLAIRAGAGSVRDTLSVLDQLIAGAGESGVTYERAVGLLGYTHAALLDDVIEAFAAHDSGAVFRAVDRVIQTGQDPRRFVEDLLERFRDLIVVKAVPDQAAAVLRGLSEDQLERLRAQAGQMGPAELSRAADVVNAALTDMTGATSPRLHLELMCARLLLPAADDGQNSLASRLDRVERRLDFDADGRSASAPSSASAEPSARPAATARPSSEATGAAAAREVLRAGRGTPAESSPETPAESPSEAPSLQELAQERAAEAAQGGTPATTPTLHPTTVPPEERPGPAPQRGEQPAQNTPPARPAPGAQAPVSADRVDMLRRAWPDILEKVKGIRRATAIFAQQTHVVDVTGNNVVVGFPQAGAERGFGPNHQENLAQAINMALGIQVTVTPIHHGGGTPAPKAPAAPAAAPQTAQPTRPDQQSSPPQQNHPPQSARTAQPGQGRQLDRPAPRQAPQVPAQRSVPAEAPSTMSSTTPAPSQAAEPAPEESSVPPAARRSEWDAREPIPEESSYFEDPYAPTDMPESNAWENVPEDLDYSFPDASTPFDAEPAASAPAPSRPETAGQPAPPRTTAPAPAPVRLTPEELDSIPAPGGGAPSAYAQSAPAQSGPSPAAYPPATASAPATSPASAAPESAPATSPAPSERGMSARERAGAQAAATSSSPQGGGRSQRMIAAQEAKAQRLAEKWAVEAAAPQTSTAVAHVEDVPSEDDEELESSAMYGRAAIERILGGRLEEERAIDGMG